MKRLSLLVFVAAWLVQAGAAWAQSHHDAPRNEAEAALVAAVHGSVRAIDFEAVFVTSPVYVRVEPETYVALEQAMATGVEVDPAAIKVWAVEPRPGVTAVAVYLSEEGFNRDHAGRHWVRLPGRNILMFAQGHGLGLYVTDANGDEDAGSHTVTWTAVEVPVVLSRNPAAD